MHLGRQDGTKIDPKTIQNRLDVQERKKVVQSPSWRHLEAILKHFVCHLGVVFIDFSIAFVDFNEKLRF